MTNSQSNNKYDNNYMFNNARFLFVKEIKDENNTNGTLIKSIASAEILKPILKL